MEVSGKTKLYRKDFNGHPAYSRRIASKEYKDGHATDNWLGVYEPVQMPRNTDLADKTTVTITKAFEAVYNDKNGNPKRKLVVREYEAEDTGFEELDEEVPWG